jgi:hypothetical protein
MNEENEVPPYQQRVIDEKAGVDENLRKLRTFFGTGVFNALETAEQERLHRQATYMTLYSGVLGERIDAF